MSSQVLFHQLRSQFEQENGSSWNADPASAHAYSRYVREKVAGQDLLLRTSVLRQLFETVSAFMAQPMAR